MYHFVCLKNPIISVFSCARYGLLSAFSDVKLRFHYCVHGSDNYDSVVHYVLAGSGILVQDGTFHVEKENILYYDDPELTHRGIL